MKYKIGKKVRDAKGQDFYIIGISYKPCDWDGWPEIYIWIHEKKDTPTRFGKKVRAASMEIVE